MDSLVENQVYVNYVFIRTQHKMYANGLIDCDRISFHGTQCGCHIDEIGGVLLVECKPHKEGKFRD